MNHCCPGCLDSSQQKGTTKIRVKEVNNIYSTLFRLSQLSKGNNNNNDKKKILQCGNVLQINTITSAEERKWVSLAT